MSSYNNARAIALKYDVNDPAPIVVASGLGHMAEKIIEVATENRVPVYEDTTLSTVLSQLQLGQSIPQELFQAVVEIYAYFLKFDPDAKQKDAASPTIDIEISGKDDEL